MSDATGPGEGYRWVKKREPIPADAEFTDEVTWRLVPGSWVGAECEDGRFIRVKIKQETTMEMTDWQVPVTASGEKDVRVGDVWESDSGNSLEIVAPPRTNDYEQIEIAGWTVDGDGYTGLFVEHLTRLISRDGVPWEDVPENCRKGRWLPNGGSEYLHHMNDLGGKCFYPGEGCPDMVWIPDAPAKPASAECQEQYDGEVLCHAGRLVQLRVDTKGIAFAVGERVRIAGTGRIVPVEDAR
jgi:hypothetical protein